jgi:hypothetical protein
VKNAGNADPAAAVGGNVSLGRRQGLGVLFGACSPSERGSPCRSPSSFPGQRPKGWSPCRMQRIRVSLARRAIGTGKTRPTRDRHGQNSPDARFGSCKGRFRLRSAVGKVTFAQPPRAKVCPAFRGRTRHAAASSRVSAKNVARIPCCPTSHRPFEEATAWPGGPRLERRYAVCNQRFQLTYSFMDTAL